MEYLPEEAVDFRPAKLAPGELGDPAAAIAIVSVSMVAITGLCMWLAAKGRGVSFTIKATAPGVSGEMSITLTEQSKPRAVADQLAAGGIKTA